jgi:hypothetical protein
MLDLHCVHVHHMGSKGSATSKLLQVARVVKSYCTVIGLFFLPYLFFPVSRFSVTYQTAQEILQHSSLSIIDNVNYL